MRSTSAVKPHKGQVRGGSTASGGIVIGGVGRRSNSAGREYGDSGHGFVRLGYGTGSGSSRGHHSSHGRRHRNHGNGSISFGLGSGSFSAYYSGSHGRFGYGYRSRHHDDYRHYNRCYSSIYGSYGLGYHPYRRAYYPYYGSYDYDPYYSYASVFDYGYRPLLPASSDTTVIYMQDAGTTQPAATETYYSAPAQPAPTAETVYSAPQPVDTEMPQVQSVAPSESTEEQVSWVELGGTAFAAGRYDEARHLYMRAVLADDTDGYAKLFYALANLAAGEYGAAATAVRRALEAAPELIDDPIDLRTVYSDASVLDEHLAALSRLAEAQPGDQEARFLLGYLHYATGKPQEALTFMQSVADASPADALAGFVRDAAMRVVRIKQQEDKP